MNKDYPIWWDSTITVFNRYENPQTQLIKWYKVVLSNCFWKYAGDRVTIGEVVLDTSSIICRIPKNEKFLDKYKWVQLPNDIMGDYFTLGIGDIIILGEVDDDINEYISGKRSSDILSKYKNLQGCMEIQQVSYNVGVGRNNEHYYVRGV